jgi:hypothetical protein
MYVRMFSDQVLLWSFLLWSTKAKEVGRHLNRDMWTYVYVCSNARTCASAIRPQRKAQRPSCTMVRLNRIWVPMSAVVIVSCS